MASGPTLPPQAYTREILTAAFNWLQTQPDSVRRLATTPDALVGLYMRAQRYGHSTLEGDAPVSSQNFMSDLKHLAEGLKQFEDPNERRAMQAAAASAPAPAQPAPQMPSPSLGFAGATVNPSRGAQNSMNANNGATNRVNNPNPYANGHAMPAQAFHQSFAPAQEYAQATAAPSSGVQFDPLSGVHPGALNQRTQEMIQEVKSSLNLSSDAEAINMMVALAYKNLKDLLA